MKPREKKLAIVLLGVLAFVWIRPQLTAWFLTPITTKKTEIESLESRIETLEIEELKLLVARDQIERMTLRSLPYDELTAQRQYQEWLTDLLNVYELQDLKVEPGSAGSSRSKGFIAVRVSVTGRGSYEQICRFLLAFENTALLHRVQSLALLCDEHSGNPPVEMRLTAEALALPNAAQRESLFPKFDLPASIAETANTLTLTAPTGFPAKAPFVIRVDQELLEVSAVQGRQWTVVRGSAGTKAVPHEAGAEVELLRIRSDRLLIPDPELQRIVAANFFLKPVPPVKYEPQLAPVGDREIVRTVPSEFPLQVSGFSPDTPPRTFALLDDVPPGLTIDPKTGVVKWTPVPTTPAGPYFVTYAVTVEGESKPRLSEETILNLVDPNLPPNVASIETQTAIAGTELKFQVSAEDPEEGTLTYSLEGEALPEGAAIDPRTGEFRWTPAADALPAELALTVRVSDSGSPPQSATQSVSISLIEDFTKDIFLTGVFNRGDDREAMLYNRAENITTVLKEGFSFEAGGVRGRVTEVGRDFVLWQTGSELWRLVLGNNLYSRTLDKTLPTISAPTPTSTSVNPADSAAAPLVAPKP